LSQFTYSIKALFCIMIIWGVSGCSAPLSEKINVRWQKYEQNGKSIDPIGWLEFFPDNTVVLNITNSSELKNNIKGVYSLSNENRIKIKIDDFNIQEISIIGQASLADNGDLVLNLDEGVLTRWKKIAGGKDSFVNE